MKPCWVFNYISYLDYLSAFSIIIQFWDRCCHNNENFLWISLVSAMYLNDVYILGFLDIYIVSVILTSMYFEALSLTLYLRCISFFLAWWVSDILLSKYTHHAQHIKDVYCLSVSVFYGLWLFLILLTVSVFTWLLKWHLSYY